MTKFEEIEQYWNRVRLCLKEFHTKTATEAKRLSLLARKVFENPDDGYKPDLDSPMELTPFDMACTIAQQSLEIGEFCTKYQEILINTPLRRRRAPPKVLAFERKPIKDRESLRSSGRAKSLSKVAAGGMKAKAAGKKTAPKVGAGGKKTLATGKKTAIKPTTSSAKTRAAGKKTDPKLGAGGKKTLAAGKKTEFKATASSNKTRAAGKKTEPKLGAGGKKTLAAGKKAAIKAKASSDNTRAAGVKKTNSLSRKVEARSRTKRGK